MKKAFWMHSKRLFLCVYLTLDLAVFTLQLAMIMNSVWGMPVRAISHIKAV